MYWHRVTNRPITSPGGGIVTSGVGEAAVDESRRHASLRENSTLAISVATQLGRSGIAHVIMNRSDNIICCKKTHNQRISKTETCARLLRHHIGTGRCGEMKCMVGRILT